MGGSVEARDPIERSKGSDRGDRRSKDRKAQKAEGRWPPTESDDLPSGAIYLEGTSSPS